jgi:protein-S-isoprenylcysteine O-methyltransferase Ste14
VAIFFVLLFLPAGRLDWWRAWVFIGVVFIAVTATMFGIFPGREELLNERYKSPIQKAQPMADKIIVIVLIATFFGSIILIPLDVFHLHLIDPPGTLVSSFGIILFVAGWSIMALSLKENAFAAPVVKHQAERHHRVIDTGLYGWVRHPMYAGFVPFILGMCLWLESYGAALLAVIPIATIVIRIHFEEQFLRRELEGYTAYTKRVRYRMIPFLW